MTLTILGMASAVLGLVIFLIRRRLTHVATPEEKMREAHEAISKELLNDDAVTANRRVDDWLRTIQSNKRGPRNTANEERRDDITKS